MLTTVALLISFGTLAAAGITHLRDLGRFRAALSAHRIWPRRMVPLVASVTPVCEAAIGALGLAATLGVLGGVGLRASLALAAALIFAAYTGYSWLLLVRRAGTPCGCSAHDLPVNVAMVARAGLLSAAAIAGALGPEPLAIDSAPAPELALMLMAGVGIGLVVWLLPAALHDPEADRPRPIWQSRDTDPVVAPPAAAAARPGAVG